MPMLRQPEPDKAYPSGEDVAKQSAGDKVAGNPIIDALQTLGMYAAALRDKGNPGAADAFKGFLEAIKGGGGGEGAAPGPAPAPGAVPPPAGQPGPPEPAGPEEGGDMPEEEEKPEDEEEAAPGGMKQKMRGRGMRGMSTAPKGFRKEATVL